MPLIHDYAYSYSTSTSGTTLACDVPDAANGDLLLAILSSDTGTPTWSCSGWVQHFSLSNSTGLAVMRRIASSEPASYTFTSSVAETLNAMIVCIKDVDTTTPIQAYANANRASHNTAFPTSTSIRDNSLILFAHGHGSTAVQPSVLEGPVSQVISKDGSAHADGLAWTIQASAGTTPNDVLSSVTGTTYNGKLVTIVINPPSGGAVEVPAYCSGDDSSYVDPLHGITAFRGNTAPAGTAATYFTGGNIAGKSIASATATARTDQGINTFRTALGGSSPTNRTWAGLALNLSAGNVITNGANNNFLCHVRPYLPVDIQTLEGVGLGRGVAMGMYSSAGNWKAWHVHGANTPFDMNRAPVVINSGASTAAGGAVGTLNANSIEGFGFFESGFNVSADMTWTMLWMLGTVTIAGGNAAGPVTIPEIGNIVGFWKERWSALQQGSNQLLLLQAVQFGNGGTNPINLDISAAAIEFPQQYTVGESYNYNSIDDVVGATFYTGASDVMDLRSSVFASKSKFHWRWHASSNGSATVETEGMQVIGGGDVVLCAAIPMVGVSFADCLTITQNACAMTTCALTDSKVISAALGDMDNIVDCAFASSGTGHAIEVGGSAATISLSGNTFTGYAASNGSTGNEAIFVNIATGTVTLNIVGGGSTPSIRTAGATVVVQNAVPVTVTVKDINTGALIENARVLIEKVSDGSDILTGLTNASGVATTSYAFTGNVAVTGKVRRATSAYGALYKSAPVSGTITSAGLDITILLIPDE